MSTGIFHAPSREEYRAELEELQDENDLLGVEIDPIDEDDIGRSKRRKVDAVHPNEIAFEAGRAVAISPEDFQQVSHIFAN